MRPLVPFGAAVGLAAALALAACSSASARPPSAAVSTTASVPAPSTPTTAPAPVPASYAAEYALVEREVAAFPAETEPGGGGPGPVGGAGATARTVLGAELLAANGNIGAGLLAPMAITSVDLELASFASLGVKGVTVDASFPLMLPGTAGSAGYRAFYAQVAQHVRNRGMKLSIEENPVFAGTVLTPTAISYRGYDAAGYAAAQRQQAQTIIDVMHPDYLTLLDEPDTFSATLGVVDLDNPDAAVNALTAETSGLRRGSTLIGAGTGTWEGPAIDQALLTRTSIDYLSVHVYPLGPVQVSNLVAEVAAAGAAHKPVVMDETWLYKPDPSGRTGVAGAPEMLKLDSYSFWAPLDARYVTEMVAYVRANGIVYASFFDGSRTFFAYLPWTPELDAAAYGQFSSQFNRVVASAMVSHEITASGAAFRQAASATP